MNFHEKIEEQVLSAKNWVHQHTPHFHHNHCYFYDDFTHHHMTKILPSEVSGELHLMYLKAHEEFLSEHFVFAKEYKKLEHKMEILKLDIAEHCHEKESEFDRKVISESITELKKVKDDMMKLIDRERERYSKFKKDIDEKIHNKIQEYLKMNS